MLPKRAEVRRGPDAHGLSRRAKYALIILEHYGEGVISTGATEVCDGQPYIHWRTARALRDRGLAHWRDGAFIALGDGR